MKILIASILIVFSASTFAKDCTADAGRIADGAIRLFDIGAENEMHCMAVGGRISLISLPVIQIWPPRSAFEAKYEYPCGPAPRYPKVKLLLDESCKIVKLDLNGFSL